MVAICLISILLLLTVLFDAKQEKVDRLLLFSIYRIAAALLFLCLTYAAAYFFSERNLHPYFLIFENSYAILSLMLACRLYQLQPDAKAGPCGARTLLLAIVAGTAVLTVVQVAVAAGSDIVDGMLVLPVCGMIFMSALFLFGSMFLLFWRLEAFWRTIELAEKRRCKYLVAGMLLVCVMLGWSASFRLTCLQMPRDHFLLLSIVSVMAFSFVLYAIVRHRLHLNKYKYRDERLAFSYLLEGKLTARGVVEALYRILQDSLYTDTVLIWLGDTKSGFRLMALNPDEGNGKDDTIPGDDPIVTFLYNYQYLYCRVGDKDPLRRAIKSEKRAFLSEHGIVLMVPLILGQQCVGFIGLGNETTGGNYGRDDFALLTALSSHAASALLAIDNAERLAKHREQAVWGYLSAFVLHDIKNAATMLDLVRKNAAQHLNRPAFQQDLLETIDDALKRMAKVQSRLSLLRGDLRPCMEKFAVREQMTAIVDKLKHRIPDLLIELHCPSDLCVSSDPEFLSQIMENILINVLEAGGNTVAVTVCVDADNMLAIEFLDNGPGIAPKLLPQALFEPFKTTKESGCGIGLWQASQLVERLCGVIDAYNLPGRGAGFKIAIPL